MSNRTKILMTALAGLALSACGSNHFTGTYTGTQTATPSTPTAATTGSGTTAGTTSYSPYGYNQQPSAASITLTLTEQGDIVTGTLTAPGAKGQLTASAASADSLSNIQVMMISDTPVANPTTAPGYNNAQTYMCANYQLTGSLSSPNKGDSLTGTLTGTQMSTGSQYGYNSSYGMGYNTCASSTLTLIKSQ